MNESFPAYIVNVNEDGPDTLIKADIEWDGKAWNELRVDTVQHPHLLNVNKFGFKNVLIDCLNPTESKN